MKRTTLLAALLLLFFSSSTASAGVWFELLYAPCWTGDDNDINEDNGVIGEYNGSIDCYNKDFNGDGERTVLSIKAFQVWEYGTMFLYYDVTGPFNSADKRLKLNEKGGFFGGITTTVSIKQVAEKFAARTFDWGPLVNLHLKYEAEHVSKFGMLHYLGLQYDLAVPHLDFVVVTSVIRQDFSLDGIDIQLGGAFQKSFSLGPADFIFGGFFSWGLFGEGTGEQDILIEASPDNGGGIITVPAEGRAFLVTQPQLLWDFGKTIRAAPKKLYLGFEYQFSINRYLIKGKSENTLSGMIRWNI